MIIRPAYPDELGRAKSLLNGHPVPPNATFLVGVKEHPVERLVAAIPWWKVSQVESDSEALRFHLHNSGTMDEEILHEALRQLEELASENQISALLTDFSLPEEHPLFLQFTAQGYEVAQTDRYFTVPGETVKSRSIRIYQRIKSKLPADWKIESIRGHDPQKLFGIVAAHGLMSPQQFESYWDTASSEHFEEDYSYVLTKGEELIGIFLLTQRGKDELHIHVEAVNPAYLGQSSLISTTLRNASFSQCPDGYPTIFTWRADSQKHRQTGNTALRQGGTEQAPRHFFRKNT